MIEIKFQLLYFLKTAGIVLFYWFLAEENADFSLIRQVGTLFVNSLNSVLEKWKGFQLGDADMGFRFSETMLWF